MVQAILHDSHIRYRSEAWIMLFLPRALQPRPTTRSQVLLLHRHTIPDRSSRDQEAYRMLLAYYIHESVWLLRARLGSTGQTFRPLTAVRQTLIPQTLLRSISPAFRTILLPITALIPMPHPQRRVAPGIMFRHLVPTMIVMLMSNIPHELRARLRYCRRLT
jgi:hypothetical protein